MAGNFDELESIPDILDPTWRARARDLGFNPDDPKAFIRASQRARALRAQLARKDPSRFCHFVLRDERNGKPIQQAPMHHEWHSILSDKNSPNVVIWSHVEGGKSNQIAIGRALYELGLDPMLKIAVISNTNDLAKKITRQTGQYITKSKDLHEVFPHLVPTDDPGLQWRAQALTVKRPGMGGKDPSIQACGMHGNIIGSRVDLLILDDVLDFENTNTPGPRDDAYRWIKYIMGRMTADGRIWAVGNSWHPEDALHRLEKDGFRGFRFPVVLPNGKVTWPQRWSLSRIEKAKVSLGPLEFARQLMCQARDDTSARFKRDWIDACIEKGRGIPCINHVEDLFDEENLTEEERTVRRLAMDSMQRLSGGGGNPTIITGVDLAVQKGSSNDETVLFTIYIDPSDGTRRILSIRSGKWTGPEIIEAIKQCYADFGGMFIVENNAAQAYITQFLAQQTSIPVVPFTTGRNKANPEFGVESLATEIANEKWIIPSTKNKDGLWEIHKEVQEWISELLFYDPNEHTGDRVMASWFAREGARRFVDGGVSRGTVGVRTF